MPTLEIRAWHPNNAEFSPGTEWVASSGFLLNFTQSGNLEIRSPLGSTIWETGTKDRNADKLSMQADGNLVIYDVSNVPIWDAATENNPGAYLTLEEDGSLSIVSEAGSILWTADSVRPSPAVQDK